MEMVRPGVKTLSAAPAEIGVSYRQAERIYKRYRAGGDEALVHGNTGRPSNHKTDKGIIDRALRLYRETSHDFGAALAEEKMRERDGLDIGAGVLRRALIQDGQWESSKNRAVYRSRRAPRKRFGELVQFDGSPHDRFEGRSSRCRMI
jgi:molybdenum-dependent DNA-binding transcriptional regulator ModE